MVIICDTFLTDGFLVTMPIFFWIVLIIRVSQNYFMFFFTIQEQTESFKRMELFCTLQCVSMLHPVKDLTSMYVLMLKNPKQEKREVKETTEMHDTLLEAAR